MGKLGWPVHPALVDPSYRTSRRVEGCIGRLNAGYILMTSLDHHRHHYDNIVWVGAERSFGAPGIYGPLRATSSTTRSSSRLPTAASACSN